jgi:hypothetical protein
MRNYDSYNYYDAVKSDVLEYVENEIDLKEFDSLDELEEHLNDTLFVHDSVTGNASGSYTFNSYVAKEYVTDNIELLHDMVKEFCIDAETIADKFLYEEWEYFDVSIRCYVLGSCIADALEELEEEFNSLHDCD